MKACNKCGTVTDDYPLKGGKPINTCRTCHNTHYRELYKNNKKRRDYIKAASKQRHQATRGEKYGLTPEEYDEYKNREACDLCGKTGKPLVIDHDHETGKVRGALCNSCNVSIGRLGDNAEGIQRALNYVMGI